MGRIEKTVFISYRRTNFWIALAIFQNLNANGYDVFFDYKSIPSGDFEQVIIENVKSRAHFIVVLTPSALERCNEPGDWLRREIETAIDNQRNIIPLMVESFDFGSPATLKALTGKLENLKKYNALGIPAEYFDEAMIKLRSERFLNRSLESVSHPVSDITKQITEEQKSAANEAALVQKDQLTAQEWFERGYLFSEAENRLEAIRCYTEAIRLNPHFAIAYGNRGFEIIESNGNLKQALNDLNEAIRLNPNGAIEYNNRGRIYSMKGDVDKAINDYGQSISCDSEYHDPYNNRGVDRLTKGDMDGAIADFDKAVSLKPDLAKAYYNRGNARRDKGDLEDAIQDYDKAIRINPDLAEAYSNRGIAHQLTGNLGCEAKDFQEAVRLAPDRGTYRSSLVNILRKLGRSKEAYEQELLARPLMQKENEYNQACFESICGNIDKALELLKIGLEKEQSTKEWVNKDSDFENIRDDPRFKALVE